jgi:peptide/nickel transport system permease protein
MKESNLVEVVSRFVNIYLAKRILYAFLSLFVILTVVFIATSLIPGSAADVILGQEATEERVQVVEEDLGLDQPLHQQYVDWVSDVAVGDFGESYVSGTPVSEIVEPRLIRSLQLAIVSIGLVTVTAVPLGVFAAAKRDSRWDSLISGVSYIGVSLPEFVTGTLLVLLLAGPILHLFPNGGYESLSDGFVPWFAHMVLPAVTLAFLMFAHVMRQTRAGMIESLQAEYIRTARLKGVKERQVLFKHALRNSLLATITVIAINFGWLMGSLVIVEEIFSYPGLGRMLINAIHNRDVPLIQIGLLIPTMAYIFANLLADIAYSILDPRIEFGE